MKRLCLALAAALWAGAAGAQTPERLRDYDRNRNGLIERGEAPARLARAFDRLDRNGDGALSREELAAVAALREGSRREGASPEATLIRTSGADGAATRADLDRHLAGMVEEQGLPGIAVIIRRGDRDVYRGYAGSYGPRTREPIASATKWFTAALVADVAEDSPLDLDDPISKWLPDAPTDKQAVTVRQTLAHISGLTAFRPFEEAERKDLDESARAILAEPLLGEPGTVFRYSGTAMQVASRIAEIADGRDWDEMFAARIAKPLGLQDSDYRALRGGAPVTGGGMTSSPADLERFTGMLAGLGAYEGVRVLEEATVRDMARLISADARRLAVPENAQDFAGMGTGVWCERADPQGRCLAISSAGAFGTYAWVDYEKGLYGVMFARGRPAQLFPHWRAIRAAAETIE